MKQKLTNILKVLLFFGIGFGIFYLVYVEQSKAYLADCALKGIPAEECSLLDKIVSDFGQVNYFWILLTCSLFMLSNWIRALRWKQLIDPMGYKTKVSNGFWCIMLGYFANLGFPRLGEIARPATFAKYEKLPVEKVVGTVAISRLVDVMLLGIFIALALLFEGGHIWGYMTDLMEQQNGTRPSGAAWMWAIPVIFGTLVVVVLVFRKQIVNLPLYDKIENILLGFWEGIKSIRQLKRPWTFVGYSISIWLLYFFMNYIAFWAFDPTSHLSIRANLTVFVFGSLGIVIPSPGGMGTYHFLVTEALEIYGVSGEDGFTFANIIFFSIQIFCSFLFGLVAITVLPLINKNYKRPKTQ